MAAENVWVGGIIAAPGRDEGPQIAVWFDAGSGRIRATQVAGEDPAASLAEALDRALEGGERPAAVRLSDEALAETVRGRLGEGASVEVGATPELDQLAHNLGAWLEHAGAAPGYLAGGSIEPAEVARLFDAARAYYEKKPWETFSEDEVFAVDIPALGVEGACLSVIGSEDEARGFTLYADVDAYRAFAEAAESGAGLTGRLLHLGFEDEGDVGATMRAEIEAHGWKPVGPHAVPALLALDDEGRPRDLEVRDHRIAVACLEAVAALAERVPDDDEEIVFTHESEGREVRLVLPHPDLDLFEDVVVAGFAEEEEARGTAEIGRAVATHALSFKEASEADPTVWSPAEVEEFLLVYVPKMVSFDEEELARVPSVFGRFLRYLGTHFESMDGRRIDKLLNQIDDLLGRFRLAVADPSRWAPAKRLAMMAHERGIDITDREAMGALVAEMNAQGRTVVRQAPKVGRNDPCPCGSGKKHKKCCGA